MFNDAPVPEALAANVTAPLHALIILKPEEECQTCHSTATDRAKYGCPKCAHVACGLCLVQQPLAARMAECPNCHERFFWPR